MWLSVIANDQSIVLVADVHKIPAVFQSFSRLTWIYVSQTQWEEFQRQQGGELFWVFWLTFAMIWLANSVIRAKTLSCLIEIKTISVESVIHRILTVLWMDNWFSFHSPFRKYFSTDILALNLIDTEINFGVFPVYVIHRTLSVLQAGFDHNLLQVGESGVDGGGSKIFRFFQKI